ncbi:hypothetical protein C8039_05455 [Halogeometricum sp. wsp3]|nr:hypothetical protein C8039_05455 [Halogeometricum sp. wsp3]
MVTPQYTAKEPESLQVHPLTFSTAVRIWMLAGYPLALSNDVVVADALYVGVVWPMRCLRLFVFLVPNPDATSGLQSRSNSVG